MPPRLFVPAEEMRGTSATLALSGDAHRHLVRVLRLRAGDRVVLFDGRGGEVEAIVARAGVREVLLELGARRARAMPAAPPVTLLVGIPRGERMDLVVQKTTELGVARIVPVLAARTTAGQQPRAERWSRIAREAARQSGRADVPEIGAALTLAAAVAAEGAGVGAGAGAGAAATTRLVLWEEAATDGGGDATPLRRAIGPETGAVALLVGPEGGLAADEVAAAGAAGFRVATLGPRILRSETAAIAAVAIVQSLVGALD